MNCKIHGDVSDGYMTITLKDESVNFCLYCCRDKLIEIIGALGDENYNSGM